MVKISKHLLHSLHLTEPQARVYLACLELGEANIQQLARKSGVKRTTIYTFIDTLVERNLLAATRRKQRIVYSAAPPQQLMEVERQRAAELEALLPELLAIHNRASGKPRVAFYEGIEGIKSVYADMLRDRKEIIAYEDAEQRAAVLGKRYVGYCPAERARLGIIFKSILRDSPAARALAEQNRALLRQSKFIRGVDWQTEVNIYGDKVALFSFRATTPFCVRIHDPDLAETLRTAWRELWNRLEGPVIG